jgi:hypothetical protein
MIAPQLVAPTVAVSIEPGRDVHTLGGSRTQSVQQTGAEQFVPPSPNTAAPSIAERCRRRRLVFEGRTAGPVAMQVWPVSHGRRSAGRPYTFG